MSLGKFCFSQHPRTCVDDRFFVWSGAAEVTPAKLWRREIGAFLIIHDIHHDRWGHGRDPIRGDVFMSAQGLCQT